MATAEEPVTEASFVKTKAELDRYYALGVRRFEGARMMGVIFDADADITASLLPPPLEQAPTPGGLIFIAEYPDTNMGPGYREAALYLRCTYRGEEGSYCLSMPIDDEIRMVNGRDVFGLPKKMASIGIERSGNRVSGWVERNGVRFVEIDVELTEELPMVPPAGPSFTFKASPRIDLQPGFDGPVLLCDQRTDLDLIKGDMGQGAVTLRPSPHDPWAVLGDLEVNLAFAMESNNTMQPGEVLTEVDGDAYLPYYFKMTELFTGTPRGSSRD